MREPGVENCRTAAACNVCTAACNVRHTERDITPALAAACSMGPGHRLTTVAELFYREMEERSADRILVTLGSMRFIYIGPRGLCFNDLIKEVKERIYL